MIVALKPGVTQESREQLMDWLQNLGLHIHVSEGEYQTILGLVGDTTKVDMDLVASLDIVDSVKRVTEPFKCCNRKFHPEDTVVEVGDVKIGGGNFCVMAGPCSVESEEQIVAVAKAVKASVPSSRPPMFSYCCTGPGTILFLPYRPPQSIIPLQFSVNQFPLPSHAIKPDIIIIT